PRTTGRPLLTVTHSAAFPKRSCTPSASGGLVATACDRALALPSCHASSDATLPFAATAATASHSASVGRRYFFPVLADNHSQNALAAVCATLMTGNPACPHP